VRKAAAPLLILLALAACSRGAQQKSATVKATTRVPATASGEGGVTPMGQRVAVIGILNKRNGIVQNVTLRPGQSARWKDIIVRLRACETTAPWEEEKLTGAFVQVDVQKPDRNWNRVFSGWLYKESPSLNVVEHPVYDVWPRSCAMTYPAGPPVPKAPASSSNLSSAKKSGRPSNAALTPSTNAAAPHATVTPPPSAAESNAT
jgi:hypothetical protein